MISSLYALSQVAFIIVESAAAKSSKKQESNEKHEQANRNRTDQGSTALNSKSFRIVRIPQVRGLDEMRERIEPRRDTIGFT
jgi:hypothetical protein